MAGGSAGSRGRAEERALMADTPGAADPSLPTGAGAGRRSCEQGLARGRGGEGSRQPVQLGFYLLSEHRVGPPCVCVLRSVARTLIKVKQLNSICRLCVLRPETLKPLKNKDEIHPIFMFQYIFRRLSMAAIHSGIPKTFLRNG